MIDAYLQNKQKPSMGDLIDQSTLRAWTTHGDELCMIAPDNVHISKLTMGSNPLNLPSPDYEQKLISVFGNIDNKYIDTHVSTFNPASFELIFNDLCSLGYLKNLALDNIHASDNSHEFIVNIKKVSDTYHHSFLSQRERVKLKIKSIDYRFNDLYFLNSGKFLPEELKYFARKNAERITKITANTYKTRVLKFSSKLISKAVCSARFAKRSLMKTASRVIKKR